MGLIAAVAGASGYAGGELLRLLSNHPDLQLGPVTAATSAGQRLADVHPQLASLADVELAPTEPASLADSDVVFLALPHGESGRLASSLPTDLPVIDLAADHRLTDPAAWARYYDTPYAGHWPYGLPELDREPLLGARRIAAPGCYPTAVILALAPLLAAGLVESHDLVVVAASGTSGAGRTAAANRPVSEVMGDLAAYKVGAHQHTPEIVQALGGSVTMSFTPVLAPMPRGILATCTARTSNSAAQLRAALTERYADEPFVQVLPEGRWPHTAATVGSNSCQLQVGGGQGQRAVVVAVLDNLGKGAAGQALQCANLALGLPETAGLAVDGISP